VAKATSSVVVEALAQGRFAEQLVHREDVGDGQVAVHLRDDALYRKSELLQVMAGANHKRTDVLDAGIQRVILHRPRRFADCVAGIAHNTHNDGILPAYVEMLAQRIFAGKVLAGEGLADDGFVAASNRLPPSKVRPRKIGMPIAPKYFGSAQRPRANRPLPCGKGGCSTTLKVQLIPEPCPGATVTKAAASTPGRARTRASSLS